VRGREDDPLDPATHRRKFDEVLARAVDRPRKAADPVDHPAHYTRFPGVEVIQITEWLNFCRGNAVKYLCRAGAKGGPAQEIEDLRKARWYVDREIERIEAAARAEGAQTPKENAG
jgi:hypothetical protein